MRATMNAFNRACECCLKTCLKKIYPTEHCPSETFHTKNDTFVCQIGRRALKSIIKGKNLRQTVAEGLRANVL